jgi:hypothetical protein
VTMNRGDDFHDPTSEGGSVPCYGPHRAVPTARIDRCRAEQVRVRLRVCVYEMKLIDASGCDQHPNRPTSTKGKNAVHGFEPLVRLTGREEIQ